MGCLRFDTLISENCVSLYRLSTNRGAQNKRAEIKPIEPDPGNAGEGREDKQMTAFYSYLPLIV